MMVRRAKRAARRKDGSRWRSRFDEAIPRPWDSRHHAVYQSSHQLYDTPDHVGRPMFLFHTCADRSHASSNKLRVLDSR
jgi:hypothetical protein